VVRLALTKPPGTMALLEAPIAPPVVLPATTLVTILITILGTMLATICITTLFAILAGTLAATLTGVIPVRICRVRLLVWTARRTSRVLVFLEAVVAGIERLA